LRTVGRARSARSGSSGWASFWGCRSARRTYLCSPSTRVIRECLTTCLHSRTRVISWWTR